jgi:hypothetical protein
MLKTHANIRPVATVWPDSNDDALGEPAITVSVDAGGTIVLTQREDEILCAPADVPEIVKALNFACKVAEIEETKRQADARRKG